MIAEAKEQMSTTAMLLPLLLPTLAAVVSPSPSSFGASAAEPGKGGA